ncbi:MAG TPA: YHS domain-containing protein [Geobacteraceae bacterium]|nr:YHS domain-containing protein [Geobacteraceae bacterium]
MLRLIFYIVIGYGLYRLIRGLVRHKEPPPQRTGEVTTYRDPVCGMYVTREDAVSEKIGGERFYFCSIDCLEKFRRDFENTSTNAKESGGNK